MDNKRLDVLRKFFAISTAAFEFRKTVLKVMGGSLDITSIETLHAQAKIELDKENPNMDLLESLVAQMEELATENSVPKPPFNGNDLQLGTNILG